MELTLPRTLHPEALQVFARQVRGFDGPLALCGHCEGLDLEAVRAADYAPERSGLPAARDLFDHLVHRAGPVLVYGEGPFSGGGLGFLGAADLVIATSACRFTLPELALGLVPGVVMSLLERRISATRARLLALGPGIDTDTAVAWGLVDVCDDSRRTLDRYQRRWDRLDPGAVALLRSGAMHWQSAMDRLEAARPRIERFLDGESPWE